MSFLLCFLRVKAYHTMFFVIIDIFSDRVNHSCQGERHLALGKTGDVPPLCNTMQSVILIVLSIRFRMLFLDTFDFLLNNVTNRFVIQFIILHCCYRFIRKLIEYILFLI